MRAEREFVALGGFLCFAVWPIPTLFFCHEINSIAEIPFLLLAQALWTIPLAITLYLSPKILVSDNGVSVQRFFAKKHYRWDEFTNAGVLYSFRRNGWINDLVLILPGSVCCRLGKRIHLNPSKEIKEFIVKTYGPLDFDHTDGQG